MQRREFMKGLAVGLAAVPLVPAVSSAMRARLDDLQAGLSKVEPGPKFWRRVGREFTLNPDLIHMNTGSTGALPQVVVDALAEYARQIEGDPLHNVWGGLGSGMEEVRAKAAAFIGAEKDEVSITRNTTEGMNEAAIGLHLKAGDEVLTTDHEHGGGMVCWQYLAKHHGIRMRYIEIQDPVRSKEDFVKLVERHVTRRTKVCSFSHVDTITGMLLPIAEIAEQVTRPRDIVLVCDGAQVPGMLQVDVKKLGVDVYCSSSHKWMLAPKGSGLFYIRKEMQERITPPLLNDAMHSHDDMRVYTAATGTRNVPTILGHGVAIDFHNTIGRDKIEARCRQLNRLVRERLRGIPGLTCLTPDPPELSSGMCTFAVDPAKAKNHEIVGRLYNDHNIIIKPAQGTYAYVPKAEAHPRNFNAIRISTHIYNDEEEVERLASVLGKMLA